MPRARHACHARQAYSGRIAALILPLAVALAACSATRPAADNARSTKSKLPPVAQRTVGLDAQQGFLDLHVDSARAQVFWQLPAPLDQDGRCGQLLYVESLRSGLGSNPVGLDRGQLGAQRVVELRRVGRRLLLIAPNLDYRARTDNRDERLAVERSFAHSVLASLEVVAEDPGEAFLVDLTPFLVRDAHRAAITLERSGQGKFKLDAKRSIFEPGQTLVFPDNVELEATITLVSEKPGDLVRRVTPDPSAVTLVQHHSFIRLPDDGYRPRAFDPRSGSFGLGFADYAAPLDQPLEQRYLERHRITHDARGNPQPIIYFVDRGAPPRIRQALVDGASWWTQAFAAAGFPDLFRVELLPEDAHPLDVRYNVIQWVHRRTRGWSYGGSITDPRTGEILKGHVSLGSLRVRQDRLIFEGLLGAAHTGDGSAEDPVELALARIRQLAAHEVGHTLGLSHNFAASTYGRASVMDYPAPWLHVDPSTGGIDAGAAYAVGIGSWDIQAIRYAYTEFADADAERDGLAAILRENRERGLYFVTDRDARPAGGAHALAHLWDNGDDPAAELQNVLDVRRVALDNFSADNLPEGRPQSQLQRVLVPVYLYHRYQAEAAIKLIGGMDYDYAIRGEGEPSTITPVAAEHQRRALAAVMRALDPTELDLPARLRELLLPAAPGTPTSDRELFRSATGPVFDALGAAATATDEILRLLLHEQRCMRLAEAQPGDLDLHELLAELSRQFFTESAELHLRNIRHTQQRLYLDRLVGLSAASTTPHLVRVACEAELRRILDRLETRLQTGLQTGPAQNANARVLAGDLRNYFEMRSWTPGPRYQPLALPPGSPIGSENATCAVSHVVDAF